MRFGREESGKVKYIGSEICYPTPDYTIYRLPLITAAVGIKKDIKLDAKMRIVAGPIVPLEQP